MESAIMAISQISAAAAVVEAEASFGVAAVTASASTAAVASGSGDCGDATSLLGDDFISSSAADS